MKRSVDMKWSKGLVALSVLLGAIAVVLLSGGAADAGPNIWTGVGPRIFVGVAARDRSGNVYAVANPQNGDVKVTYNGHSATTVYKSTDGGQTWAARGDYTSAGGVVYSASVYAMAASSDGSVLMLNVESYSPKGTALVKSTDSGETWQYLKNFMLPAKSIIRIDPTDANRVYASGTGGVYTSTDGGVNWRIMMGVRGGAFDIDPANPARLVAPAQFSMDYGATWQMSNVGNSPDRLFSVTEVIFAPRPGGQSWAVAYAPGSKGTVFVSKDGGLSYAATLELQGRTPIGMDVTHDGVIYVAFALPASQSSEQQPRRMDQELYFSVDGEKWALLSRPRLLSPLTNLDEYASPPTPPEGKFFISQEGDWTAFSSDGTYNRGGWSGQGPSPQLPLTQQRVSAFVMDGTGWLAASGQHLYWTNNSGNSWHLLYSGADGFYSGITGMATLADNSIVIHLSPAKVTGGPGGHYERGDVVLRSTDRGVTWSEPILRPAGAYVKFTLDRGIRPAVYAAASPLIETTNGTHFSNISPGGLYKSTDSGATWITLTVGMPVNNVLVDPADGQNLLAAGMNGLAESHDAGATWSLVRTNPQVGGLVLHHERNSTILYAYGVGGLKSGDFGDPGGLVRGPLYKSTDAGRSWSLVNITGAPPGYIVQSFTVPGPGYRSREVGTGEGSGAILVQWSEKPSSRATFSLSRDGGRTWQTLNGFGLSDFMYWGSDTLGIDEGTSNVFVAADKLRAYRTVAEQPNPASSALWQRQDEPVQKGIAKRSWTWGPQPFSTLREPLDGLPGGGRIVQYYDKSRMEVNDPDADPKAPWFVTNGLLTVEMVAGRVQMGLNRWEPRAPSYVPVAGDANPGNGYTAPSYASFRGVASYEKNNNKLPNAVGKVVDKSIDAGGSVNPIPAGLPQVRLAAYDAQGGHNIAAPFWEYLNRKGPVLENGRYVERPILGDWVFVMGRPITEPYWTQVRVGNDAHWVLVQLFERRVLTYNPKNAPEWQVEMGNVGLHYYVWRYGDNP